MEKQIFSDPLVQPIGSYLDLLDGVYGDFKDWLKKLGAGRQMTGRQYDDLISCIEVLSHTAGTVEEWKAAFLFCGSKVSRYFDEEKLEEERLNLIPSLFSGRYGTFCCYVNDILPEIKVYAETHPVFKEKYIKIKKKARENNSAAGRMEIYSSCSYPPALIAELEEIAESDIVPELLPFLCWGKKVYLTMYRLNKGDTGKDLYRDIPRWNNGSRSFLPFIGYAAVKRDVTILQAVFEGMESTEVIRILTGLFFPGTFHAEYCCFTNWLDKAIFLDFYRENYTIYRKCKGLCINPGEEDKAELFLEYCTLLLGQNVKEADLPVVQIFFSGAAPEKSRGPLQYLDYIYDIGKNERAYWQLIKAIVERAACYPAADLLPRERFRSYGCGDIGISSFYILERYLNAVKPDRETLILLGEYICVILENQRIGTPSQLLWLFNRIRLADYCEPFIGEADFLTALLAAAGETEFFSITAYNWINYVVTIRLLLTYRDRKPDPLWPVRIGDAVERQFEGADGENPLYAAAALLLSQGEIDADPVLLDCIWNLFLKKKAEEFIRFEPGFIPYLYFIRTSGDEDKVKAMLEEARSELIGELLFLRYLRINQNFHFNDFILQLDNAGIIESLPPEVFAQYRTTQDEAVLRYLDRHGTTFEKVKHITSHYRGFE
jgi:hypothetical protein